MAGRLVNAKDATKDAMRVMTLIARCLFMIVTSTESV
jgi:hypothetical protein